MIGCGKRSKQLSIQFSKLRDCEIVALCDPDTAQIDKLIQKLLNGQEPVDLSSTDRYQDYRHVLDRSDVDAVVVASPNHWHSLHAIHAMQAGKDVYVEKPLSHNFWEGQQLAAAEAQYDQVLETGFQNRSDPGPIEGIRYVREGHLGKILSVHACCFRNRDSIGAVRPVPLVPPTTCDYNLWLGPVQDEPIVRQNLHYDWHWVWNTGNGDIGNQGPHEIDMAYWAMGDSGWPTSIRSFGNRFGWNDAGETPNMQTAWFEQNGIPCVIEVNDLKLAPDRNAAWHRNGIRVGIIVRCEGGELRGGRGGMYTVAEDGKTRLETFPGNGGAGHQQNFIDVVRSRRRQDLRAPIQSSEPSSAIVHLANASLRSGQVQGEATVLDAVGENSLLRMILQEQSTQLARWSIDQPEYMLGQVLQLNPQTRSVSGEGVAEMLRPQCRPGFVIPELVSSR
jgi:predicted dehydrogenase